MAERLELGFQKTISVKEQLARTTLNIVRLQGHPYVELREDGKDGKKIVFFCTLCLAPCYSDSVLFNHLRGNLHKERLSSAKLTLLKPNPWPFNDGLHFFNTSLESVKESGSGKNRNELLDSHGGGDCLAIVEYDENTKYGYRVGAGCDVANANGGVDELLVPGVLIKDEISVLKMRLMGNGLLAARLRKEGNFLNIVSRIWCEWLGKSDPADENESKVSEHEFAIVTFPYYYDLGRERLVTDVKLLVAPGSATYLENGSVASKKRKKSFSDPGDVSESLSNQYESSGGESPSSNGGSLRLLVTGYDDQLLHTRFISSKKARRDLRRKKRIAAERMCGICLQRMLPEKDVATLMNIKTGKLACASRNVNGAFHIFHTSCLIHWVLLCESEIIRDQAVGSKGRTRSQKKNRGRGNKAGKKGKTKAAEIQINSVLCPECQGTGVTTAEVERELPTVPLPEMFKHKIRMGYGYKAWMKNPEDLKNCSTGFYFPSQSEEAVEERVLTLKLLRFYRADEESCMPFPVA